MTKPPVLWFLVAFLAGVATAQSPDAAAIFAHAIELQTAGDFAAAIAEYRHVLTLDPASFSAHANLGAALAHQGEYESAIAEYQAALNTAPAAAAPAVRQNMGLAFYKSGQLAEAADEFEAVRQADPSQANAVLLAADCYLRMGEFNRVFDLLNPVSVSDPENRAVTYMLGMALIRSGRPDEGQKLVERLLRGGESAETHYLLGSVAFMGKDYAAAVAEFGAAVKLDRTLPSLYSYYGRALLFSGDPDGAGQAFRQQLAADPNDYDANFQLGEILRFRKDFSGAEPLYSKASTLRPAAVEPRYGLALCDIAAARYGAAREVLDAVIAKMPDFAAAHAALAEADQGLGLRSNAEAERTIAAKLAPQRDVAGFAAGSQAPDFALLPPTGETRVRLSSFRGKKPAVVVFGSYTCPKFRSQVDALNTLYARYRDRAGFLLVYIREAHADSSWQSTANTRAGVALPEASNLDQKRAYASMCLSRLKIHYPAVVDGMDGEIEKQWSAFPSRVYVVDKAGRVVFNSVLDQQQFDAAALEAALRKAF